MKTKEKQGLSSLYSLCTHWHHSSLAPTHRPQGALSPTHFVPPRATARVPTPLCTTPALTRLCWRMRLRGDSHPPAGRPPGSPLLWTGLESRFPRGMVGATLVVAQ